MSIKEKGLKHTKKPAIGTGGLKNLKNSFTV